MSRGVVALLQIALLGGCAQPSHALRGKGPTALPPVVVATPTATPPAWGNAEDELLAQLRGPATLYYQTVRRGAIGCEAEPFTPIRDTGADFKKGTGFFADSRVMGGTIGSAFAGEGLALHGYSEDSLLIDGSEWFYSLEACLAQRGRYPPADAAAEVAGLDIGALVDRYQYSSVWFLAGYRVEVSGRRDAWYTLGDAVYRARFYPSAPVAWLRGPLNRPAKSEAEARHGLYRASGTATSFDVGPDHFCADPSNCPAPSEASRLPIVPGPPLAGLVDFAEQFWNYRAPLFVPVRDSGGTSCQELQPRPGEALIFRAFDKRNEFRITRAVGGFFVWRDPEGGTWSWARMVVHGRDQQRFIINGSPWYFRSEDCLAGKDHVKAANFRVPGMVTLADTVGNTGRVKLETEYFALRMEAAGAACRAVKIEPHHAGGRAKIETSTGSEERDYDFYTDEWAFWFGPVLRPGLRGEARYHGHMVVPARMAGGIVMDGEPWYSSKARCSAALSKRTTRP